MATTKRSRSTTKRSRPSGFRDLFPSPAVTDVLSLLLLNPDDEFYQREIAARTGNILRQVQRALKRIEAAGLVTKTRRGNRVYYKAERGHPAFEDLKRAFLKTVALGDALRAAVGPLGGEVRLAFVYGSLARGEETARSDIDLILVGNLTVRGAAKTLGPIGRELGREFNPVVFPPAEFRKKARGGDHFVSELLKSPKIWLIGDDRELARLVE